MILYIDKQEWLHMFREFLTRQVVIDGSWRNKITESRSPVVLGQLEKAGLPSPAVAEEGIGAPRTRSADRVVQLNSPSSGDRHTRFCLRHILE